MTTTNPAIIFSLDDLAGMTANLLFGEPYEADEDTCADILRDAFNDNSDDTLGAITYMIKQHPAYDDNVRDHFIGNVQGCVENIFTEDLGDIADDDPHPIDPDHARDVAFDL